MASLASLRLMRMSRTLTEEGVRAIFAQPDKISTLSSRMLSFLAKSSKSDTLSTHSSRSSHLVIEQSHSKMMSSDRRSQAASSDTVLVVKSQAYNLLSRKTHAFKYVLGDTMGCETRNIEFKLGGGGYVQNQLGKHVVKYMCAFLNTDGGKLIIGVADSGNILPKFHSYNFLF